MPDMIRFIRGGKVYWCYEDKIVNGKPPKQAEESCITVSRLRERVREGTLLPLN